MLEYRLAFLTDMLTTIVFYGTLGLTIWILLDRFKMLHGWTLYQVLFLFNLNIVAYGIAAFIFYWPMVYMEQMVQRGEFDIVLVRPMNSLSYIILGRPTYAFIGHLILGAGLFVICFTHLALHVTALNVIFLVLDIGGAVLIHAALFLFIGALTFWIVRTYSIFDILTNTFDHLNDYPISIYGKVIQGFLTFIIPLAFINFYPARFFLQRIGDNLFNPALRYGTPAVGIVFFFLAYRLWKIGVNRYESTGS
jgi:ABC-2 type transport system permease protein